MDGQFALPGIVLAECWVGEKAGKVWTAGTGTAPLSVPPVLRAAAVVLFEGGVAAVLADLDLRIGVGKPPNIGGLVASMISSTVTADRSTMEKTRSNLGCLGIVSRG